VELIKAKQLRRRPVSSQRTFPLKYFVLEMGTSSVDQSAVAPQAAQQASGYQ
jgi:hypothetical protein